MLPMQRVEAFAFSLDVHPGLGALLCELLLLFLQGRTGR